MNRLPSNLPVVVTAPLCPAARSVLLRLYRRRIILQHLCNCFSEVLLLFVRLCFGIEGLGCCSFPHQRLLSCVVYVQVDPSDVNGRSTRCGHSTPTPSVSVPAIAPARTIAPAAVERRVLLLLL